MSETDAVSPPRMHDLKTVQPYFDDVASGRKTFEMRQNDRAFQAGDIVLLREYRPRGTCTQTHEDSPQEVTDGCRFTGRVLRFTIGYVLGAAPVAPLGDHVVFSLLPAEETTP